MTLPPRALRPFPEITAPWWGSRPRPPLRHAFDVHRIRRLLHDTKSGEEKFPRRDIHWQLPRKELLRRLEFPRDYGSPLSSKRWIRERAPRLLMTLIYYFLRYPFWRMQNPREELEEGVVVKSFTGRLFYGFVRHSDCQRLINETIRPVGALVHYSGSSMLPTLGANFAISITSYAYVERRDVRVGDVVSIMPPNFDEKRTMLCKRVAALEGQRLWVRNINKQINEKAVLVPRGHCLVVGDNANHSGDARQIGTMPINAIWDKLIWQIGPDGWYRVDHNKRPWEENKSIYILAPGRNTPPKEWFRN